jgi:DNA repair ATPase RecN
MEKNFKMIIIALASLAVVLIGVLIYVWTDRNSLIDDLTVEKEDLTAQMIQLQNDYANLSTTNDTLNTELMLEREKVAQLIERVKKTEASNKAKLRKYEKELGTLRSIMRGYIRQIDSLNTLNTSLRAEAAKAKEQAKESASKYESLKSTTEELGKQVELGSIVKGRGISAVGINNAGKETNRSSRVDKIKACVTLVANSIAKKGLREVYLRVKGPDGILMTPSQDQLFATQESIHFSLNAFTT